MCVPWSVPSAIYISIFTIYAGPTHNNSIAAGKIISLICLHDRIKNVVIAAASLPPVFKTVKLWGKTVCPGAPSIVGKAAPKCKQSFHALGGKHGLGAGFASASTISIFALTFYHGLAKVASTCKIKQL